MTDNILCLPHEVLHCIIVNTEPQDLAALCCCRALNDFIKNDRLLHKEMYLRNFDRRSLRIDNETAWGPELRKLIKFQKILASDNASLKAAQLRTIAESVQDLLTTAAVDPKLSLNIPFLTHLFEKRQNIDVLLCRSSLFDWVRSESWGSEANRRFVRGIAAMIQDTDGHDPENGAVNESLPGQSVEHRNGPLNVDALGLDNPTSAIAEPRHLNHVFLNRFAPGENYPANRPSYNVPKNSPELVRDSSVHQVFFNRQLCAKLHCLYGVPISSVQKDSDASIRYTLRRETVPIHSYARSLVYDLRQHTEDGTFWGPFLDDGLQTVDWEKMEAVMIMLDFNLRRFTQAHRQLQGLANLPDKPFIGATPYSFISPPQSAIMEPSVPLEAQDPYNITGTWMRIVCFLDYQELYAFNFSSDEPEQGQPRKPIDTEEATRLINMIIRVTKIEPPGENDGKGLPVVHFAGKSSAITPLYDPNANSKIKGTVRLTPQGEVRWASTSIFNGEERWRSEGIQVGGVQSARGVLGYWFDKDYDEAGPAGPTAFWKLHDGIEVKTPPRTYPTALFTVPLY